MVLRTASLVGLLGALLSLLLVGCLSKHNNEVLRVEQPMGVTVAAVMGFPDRRDVTAVPKPLADRLTETLQARNLVPHMLPPESYTDAFLTKRSVPHRLGYMGVGANQDALLLLVETEPRFFSQLTGRYRWTVTVRLTLAPRDNPEAAVTTEFSGPVFLQFYHEREEAALEAAGPIIERHLGYLLDEYLGGVGG